MPRLLALALPILPLLLLPVALLLFLNLRLSRRLRYPRELLAPDERRGPAAFLFRSFRTHYDVLVDGLVALLLALALADSSPPAPGLRVEAPGGRRAVVLDCSRSMIAGPRGDRPLDRAAKALLRDASLAGADGFALALDPEKGRERLVGLEESLAAASGDAVALAGLLERRFTFFSADPRGLAELSRRGYRDIVFLTDRLSRRAEGFRVLELGWGASPGSPPAPGFESSASYPATAGYDRAEEAWIVVLAESGPRAPIKVSAWSEAEGGFVALPPTAYSVEDRPAGRALRLEAPGLHLLSLGGPRGIPGADFPLFLGPARRAAAASGPFSEAMLRVFPLLEKAPRPELVLEDEGHALSGNRKTRIVTALEETDGAGILPPGRSGSRLLAARHPGAGADFAFGPAGLANEDLPLVYDAAILGSRPPPYLHVPPPGTRRLLPAGSAFVALGAGESVALIPPASDFFESSARDAISLPLPPPRRALWAILLALTLLGKFLLFARLSGKRPLAREA